MLNNLDNDPFSSNIQREKSIPIKYMIIVKVSVWYQL